MGNAIFAPRPSLVFHSVDSVQNFSKLDCPPLLGSPAGAERGERDPHLSKPLLGGRRVVKTVFAFALYASAAAADDDDDGVVG